MEAKGSEPNETSVTRLLDPEVRRRVFGYVDGFRRWKESIRTLMGITGPEAVDAPPRGEIAWSHCDSYSSFGRFFDEELRPLLGPPCSISPEDLKHAVMDHLVINAGIDAETGYQHAVNSLRLRSRVRHSQPFLISDFAPIRTPYVPFCLWRAATGFELFVVGSTAVLYVTPIPAATSFVQLQADCTEAAMHAAENELKDLLPSISRTLLLAGCWSDFKYHPDLLDCGYFGPYSLGSTGGGPAADASTAPEVTVAEDGAPPADEIAAQGDIYLPLVSTCLDFFFSCPSEKDTTDRRLRNALYLLAQADIRTDPAIQLALSFSAIEALVCRKSEGITDELSRNAVTLLQPNASSRRAAVRRVKQLYRIRCKVLHGESTEASAEAAMSTRVLGAGVFRAVLEWALFSRRLTGSVSQPSDFFEQLEEALLSGKEMLGVFGGSEDCLPPNL